MSGGRELVREGDKYLVELRKRLIQNSLDKKKKRIWSGFREKGKRLLD